MYPEDIENLFAQVSVGTPVRIIHEPIKAGWQGDILFLEIHRPLESEEQDPKVEPTVEAVLDTMGKFLKDSDKIDSYSVKQAFLIGDGIPLPVATRRNADSVDFNGAPPAPPPITPKLLP